jgi:MFS transporter, DHA2 family, metal-tetracycline-proton antiporter
MTSQSIPKKQEVIAVRIKYEGMLYSAIFLNTIVVIMNTSMFNIALPFISNEFQLNEQLASIIVSSYSLFFAFSAILYSKLSSSFPIKILLIIGICFLSIGSIIGMTAISFPVLIGARIIQAIGASSISALSIIITTRYIPAERRGKQLGIVASAVTLGMGLGPILGGVITDLLGWEYLFGLSLILLTVIPFYMTLLPIEKYQKRSFDYVGMTLFFLSIIILLCSINISILFLLLSVLTIFFFIFHIRKSKVTFIEPSLLNNYSFLRVTGIGLSMYACNFSFLFVLPLLLAQIFEIDTAVLIGLVLLPGALFSSFMSILAGKAVDRIGGKKVALMGTVIMATAATIAGLFGTQSIFYISLIFSISSSGFVCITTSLPTILAKLLPADLLTTGIGTLQLFQFIGGSIGVTIAGKLITQISNSLLVEYKFIIVFIAIFLSALVAFLLINSLREKDLWSHNAWRG